MAAPLAKIYKRHRLTSLKVKATEFYSRILNMGQLYARQEGCLDKSFFLKIERRRNIQFSDKCVEFVGSNVCFFLRRENLNLPVLETLFINSLLFYLFNYVRLIMLSKESHIIFHVSKHLKHVFKLYLGS
jgi:hypothetical protein